MSRCRWENLSPWAEICTKIETAFLFQGSLHKNLFHRQRFKWCLHFYEWTRWRLLTKMTKRHKSKKLKNHRCANYGATTRNHLQGGICNFYHISNCPIHHLKVVVSAGQGCSIVSWQKEVEEALTLAVTQ